MGVRDTHLNESATLQNCSVALFVEGKKGREIGTMRCACLARPSIGEQKCGRRKSCGAR